METWLFLQMSELIDCINNLSAKDIIRSIAKTANGIPFYLQTIGVGGFSPLDVSGLAYWFDGMDETTLTLAGNDVTQWDDKSGNSRNVTPGANSPSYSAVTHRLTFDKTNTENLRNTSFTLTAPYIIFVAYKKTVSTDTSEYMIGSPSNVAGLIGTSSSGAGRFLMLSGVNLYYNGSDGNDNIHTCEFNGVNSNYWLNDVGPTNGDSGANNPTGVEIGSVNNGAVHINAELMELFAYDNLITAQERTDLIAYLQDKWGI